MSLLKIAVVICIAHFSVYSQNVSFSWGDYDKFKGLMSFSIVPVNETDFYDVSERVGLFSDMLNLKPNLVIRFCKNNNLIRDNKLEFKHRNESIQEVIHVNNKMVLVTSSFSGKNVTYYAYEVSSNLTLGKAKKILSRKFKGAQVPKVKVVSSSNGQYFGFMLSAPVKKDDALVIRFKLFNANLEEVSSGDVSVPYNKRDADFDLHHISNNGDYFVGYKVYETNNRGKVNRRAAVKDYVIRHNFEGGSVNYHVKLKEGYVKDVYFSSDDSSYLYVTGLWGGYERALEGVFTMKIDYQTKEVIEEVKEPFSREFILSTFPDKKREQFEEDEDKHLKDKDMVNLSNFVFRSMIPTSEGAVVLMEEYYEVEVYRHDKYGSYTDYYYYIKGVIAYLIKNDGSIGWIRFLHKEHTTKNDYGKRSSFGYIYNDDNIVLFFNDSKKCYDENGKYNDLRIRSAFVKGSYAFAQASIDVKTGAVDRRMIHDFNEGKGFVLPSFIARTKNPSVAIVPMINRNMTLFQGKKRYGTVRL